MTKEIELTQGKVTVVDADVYDSLNKHNWYALKNRSTHYAVRHAPREKGLGFIYMHREILGLVQGDGKIVDHINRDGLNNRQTNLRIVSPSHNQCNRRVQSNNKSGYNGVYYIKRTGKYGAEIAINCKNITLGYFDNIEDAVEARQKGEDKYWASLKT